MKSKATFVACLPLLLAVWATSGCYHRDRTTPSPPVPAPVIAQPETVCGDHCGTERWRVKSLTDADHEKVSFTPTTTSVDWLVSQPAPTELPESGRIAPVETQTFEVRARLVGFKEEADRDFHVVIAALDSPSLTMIVEIPSPSCAGACASRHVEEFRRARAVIVDRFGHPTRHFTKVRQDVTVVVTGVGFFDFVHGQTGVAPNGIELHPVLNFRVEDASSVSARHRAACDSTQEITLREFR